MKSYKFITEKIQSKILMYYVLIALIYFNINIALMPYKYINPQTALEWFVCIAIGVFILAFIFLIAIGIFVIDSVKEIKFEDN